jgi:hypothetical protein
MDQSYPQNNGSKEAIPQEMDQVRIESYSLGSWHEEEEGERGEGED